MMDRLVKKALKTTEKVKILYFPKIVFLNRFSGTVLAFIKKRKTFTRGGDTVRNLFKHLLAAAVVGVLSANVFAATTINVTVYANNLPPGDSVTSATNFSFAVPIINSGGWFYNNMRNYGYVGIRTDLPRSGNGSVWFKGEQVDKSKADIEYLPTRPLGTLNDLSLLSYEWYRKSGTTYSAAAHLHPVIRLLVGDTQPRGYLIFERAYNPGVSPVPTDTWVPDTVGDATVLWASTGLRNHLSISEPGSYKTLADWKSLIGSYNVYGLSAGIGSGWGTFEGAVDNISYRFGSGPIVTTNFEVVPEPTTMALFGLGLLGAAGGLLRRKSA
jgi:hypothetical protein